MKTSSRIAFQFTIWIAIISGILLWIINSVFLYWWIRSETQNVAQFVVLKNLQPRNPFTDSLQRQERVMAFDERSFRPNDFPTFWWINRIRVFDWRRWLVSKSNKYYVLFDVSQNINRQLGLFSASTISWLLVLFSSFIFGRLFVQRSLRDLHTLSKKLRKRDVSQANWWLVFHHLPEHDEINSIAKAVENLENRIQWYYANLRQFVGNVSHELKTPLMVMRSEIDISNRTKKYDELSHAISNSVQDMQATVDTLLTLTRLQSQDTIEKHTIQLSNIISDTVSWLHKKYTNKEMYLRVLWDSNDTIEGNEQLIKILLTNIIDNAWKYGEEKSNIYINFNQNNIVITNVWLISQEIIDNMRTPFWQADKNRQDWVGIWLSLVKEIIRLHDWEIAYTSDNNIVTCTIYITKKPE